MSKLSAAIGRKIMMLRRRRGLTLSELARSAGISKSTLSEIESGNVNPTINTLWAIARALGVSFGELVEPLQEICTEDVCVQLLKRGFNAELYIMHVRRGVTYMSNPHPEGTRESVIVLRGRLLCGPLDRPMLLEAGSSITFSADRTHIYATFDEDTTLLVLIRYRRLFASPNEVLELDVIDEDIIAEKLKKVIMQVQNSLLTYHLIVMGSEDQIRRKMYKYMKDLQKPRVKMIYVERDSGISSIFVFHRDPLEDKSWLKLDLENTSELLKQCVRLYRELSFSRIDKQHLLEVSKDLNNTVLNLVLIEYLSFLGELIISEYLESLYKMMRSLPSLSDKDTSLLYTILEPLSPGFVREVILVTYYVEKLLRNRGKLKVLYLDRTIGQLILHMLQMLTRDEVYRLELTCLTRSSANSNFLVKYLSNYNVDILCGDLSIFDNSYKFDVIILRDFELLSSYELLTMCHNVLNSNGFLIVVGRFLPYFTDLRSRIKAIMIHYLAYVVDSIIEFSEDHHLSESERRFMILVKTCCADTLHELLSNKFMKSLSYFFKYYKDVENISHSVNMSNLRNIILMFFLSNYLKLRDLRFKLTNPDKETTISNFVKLVERSGFELTHSYRIYPTYDSGGTYVITFKRV